jgi:hypothetical protein
MTKKADEFFCWNANRRNVTSGWRHGLGIESVFNEGKKTSDLGCSLRGLPCNRAVQKVHERFFVARPFQRGEPSVAESFDPVSWGRHHKQLLLYLVEWESVQMLISESDFWKYMRIKDLPFLL